jgi:transcription-repair coupling factor (superfamily II helicase)
MDTAWQKELEASFPYVETEDQLAAIDAVKADMQRAKPMDRLVCGDVGFGKTEVALRAAFKAVQDGKQVAVLVPTTVLAQQHFNTFVRRLGSYPIKIDMLSRFRTAAEKRKLHVAMAEGDADIVIGTHGLVAEGVKFRDLGLLIIDEEQRFGIKDKDRLKKLRANVDVLTLTATPIPRTLYLGLSGVRDVSRIETPPVDRLPIITHVGPADDHTIQQAIRRELDRDGQVFVVHNRVQTLGFTEERIRRLVPEASIAGAHGQMEERKLAQVMNAFSDGKYQVLVCTNIIESGLDIPNANTIIIDRADMFGLGELYQLRGRVGRSNVQAYAYFLHERRTRLTDEARDRLETMREAKGIGAGYMIAMRDLELRGAGDMLGTRQSGQVHAVGLDLYTRLLSREISTLRALRDGTTPPEPEKRPLTIDLPLTVGLPESYVPDAMLRVQLYRRVASLDNEPKIQAFEEELADRFGKLPAAVQNLTFQARLKLHAEKFGAQSITSEGNRFTVRADLIEKMNSAALRIVLGEDGNIGRRQISWLRAGTPDLWKKKLMDVIEWMARSFS